MTSMITADDVRGLLSGGPDAVLVVVAGSAAVLRPSDLDDERYRGALQVITREELIAQSGRDEFSDSEIAEQAAALDTAVSELGG